MLRFACVFKDATGSKDTSCSILVAVDISVVPLVNPLVICICFLLSPFFPFLFFKQAFTIWFGSSVLLCILRMSVFLARFV